MVTLANLRTAFYNRFDEGQQNYIQVAEANQILNEAGSHLHNWLVTEAEYYLWKEMVINTIAAQMDYVLPADCMKLLEIFGPAVGQNISPSLPGMRPLKRIMPKEYRGPATMIDARALNALQPYGYLDMGNIIRILPTPQQVYQITLWYAPQWTDLVSDTDVLEICIAPGWQEFIINQAVIAARLKEESDTTALERRQQQIMALMQSSMVNRDMANHSRVVDVQGCY